MTALVDAPGKIRGMVLKHCPVNGDHWKSYFSGHSTVGGLASRLREGVKKGRWSAWMIVCVVENSATKSH
jgi:hypothetical protein